MRGFAAHSASKMPGASHNRSWKRWTSDVGVLQAATGNELMATYLLQLLVIALAATGIVVIGHVIHAPNWLVYVFCGFLGFGALLVFRERD